VNMIRGLKWVKSWRLAAKKSPSAIPTRSSTGDLNKRGDDATVTIQKEQIKITATKTASYTLEMMEADRQDERFDKALVETIKGYLKDRDLEKPGRAETRAISQYDLDKDVKVQVLQFKAVRTERVQDGAGDGELEGLMEPYQEEENLLHDGIYRGRFPDQVSAVEVVSLTA
jgi:hypothetical protein